VPRTDIGTRQSVRPYSGAYEVLGDIELAPEEAAKAERLISVAESERAQMHVTLRWGRTQLDIVRRASQLYGMPYQAYVKQAAFRQAVIDLQNATKVGIGSFPERLPADPPHARRQERPTNLSQG
jgi:hypothetical protein